MRKLLGVLLTVGLILGVPASPALAVDGAPGADALPGASLSEETPAVSLTEPGELSDSGNIDPSEDAAEPDVGTTLHREIAPEQTEPEEIDPAQPEPIAAPTRLPSVSGTAQVEQTLRGSVGEWDGEDLAFAMQWQVDGVDILGATSETFLLLRDYASTSVRLAVTASRPGVEPFTVFSDAVFIKAGLLTAGALKVSGSTSVGQKLSVAAQGSQPSGATLSYQWKRAGTAIPGATKASYTLTSQDLGKQITVTVTSTLTGFAPAVASAGAGKSIAAGALTSVTPKISGAAVVGTMLKSSMGSWKPGGTALKYQWKRNGTAIAKATGSSYKLTTADVGKKITLSVTGSLAGYTSRTVTSTATGTVLRTLSATPAPKISGSSKVGAKLTVSTGTWKPAPVSLSYQWLRNGKAISGATKSSYTLAKADGGAKITVRVTGKKSGYASVTKVSTSRSIPKVLSTAKPKISGSALVGSKLTVSRGKWTAGTKISTQWLRNGSAIRGATGASYTLRNADIGTKISVQVSGSKSGYSTATQVSAATAAVKTPSRTKPITAGNCPAWAPIKGNQGRSDWIYHVPGSTYYSRTIPEECFSTTRAAEAAGYRAPLR